MEDGGNIYADFRTLQGEEEGREVLKSLKQAGGGGASPSLLYLP